MSLVEKKLTRLLAHFMASRRRRLARARASPITGVWPPQSQIHLLL